MGRWRVVNLIQVWIAQLQLVDGDPTQTNLWSVAQDTIYHDEPTSFADREAATRVYAWDWESRDRALEQMNGLLEASGLLGVATDNLTSSHVLEAPLLTKRH